MRSAGQSENIRLKLKPSILGNCLAAPRDMATRIACKGRVVGADWPLPTTANDYSMTVARITEISSVSAVSFEDAITQGVARANKDQEVTIDNGKVTRYKVVLKVTFILQD